MRLGVQLDSSHLQVLKITVATVACCISHIFVFFCVVYLGINNGGCMCTVVQGCESSTWRSSLDCDGREVINTIRAETDTQTEIYRCEKMMSTKRRFSML